MALFNGINIYSYFNKIEESLKNRVNSYSHLQLVEFSDKEVESIADYYRVVDINVDFENASMSARNGEGEVYNYNSRIFSELPEYITVKGKLVTFFAPVIGDHSLLKHDLCEQRFEMFNYHDENYQEMDVYHDADSGNYCVKFEIFFPDYQLDGKNREEILSILKEECNNFTKTTVLKIKRLKSLIKSFNDKLFKYTKKCIEDKIHDDSSLEFLSNAIGVELKTRNEFQEKNSKISILPKKFDPMLPTRKKYDGYYLDKNNYSAIISTIRNHLTATENNPAAIKKLNNEELIRDTILWALNSNYIVSSGESFRNNGKTDILINFNDKSVYVAECKMWNGKSYFEDGLKQLLCYSTWRDSKMSMIVFNNKNKDFANVCKEAKDAVKNYSGFKKILSDSDQNFFECEILDPNNTESVITLSLICANYVDRDE